MKLNNKLYRLLLVPVAAFLMGSCKIGKQYTRPNIDLPSTLDSTSVDSISIGDYPWEQMYTDTILQQLTRGVVNVLPIAILMGFISGFGAVVQSTAAFHSLLSGLLSMNMSPYLVTFLGIAIMSACMGNGTSAMVMVLNALQPVLTTADVNYNLIHRIATTTASTTDSMPHCPNVCVAIQAFGLTHKKSYKYVFISTVCIPLVYAGAVTAVAMLIG